MTRKNAAATPSDVTAGRTALGTWWNARQARRAESRRAAGDLWALVKAAEEEEEWTRERYEAFRYFAPTWGWLSRRQEAERDAHAAWMQAETARHDLDAFLHPQRYASRGYRDEALHRYRARAARAEAKRELEAGS